MDAEGVAFVGKVQKERLYCGDLFTPLLTARKELLFQQNE